MAFPATLAEFGYYLLWAIGLILLLILILSAAALLLTRVDVCSKLNVSNGVFLKKSRIFIRFLFLKYKAFEIDDFEDEDPYRQSEYPDYRAFEVGDFEDEDPVKQTESRKSESKTVEKSASYVTQTGGKIKIKTVQSQNRWNVYDVVIETSCRDEEGRENVQFRHFRTEFNEDKMSFFTEETENLSGTDDLFDTDDLSGTDDLSDADDLSGIYDDMTEYADLSNPIQFARDSLTAGSKISKPSFRLIGAFLLRTNIKKLFLRLDYGLSDPTGTAVSYGVIQSFISGVYAYLDDASKRSRSSRKRKRCQEIASHIQDNVFITPRFMANNIDIEFEASVSFWFVRSYVPLLRFLIDRNTFWVLRRYVWVYYVKHYLKNYFKNRKRAKSVQKEAPASL